MNIVFICQKGELELKSLLLAWSLRKTHAYSLRLIAAVPTYKDWGDISVEARNLFAVLKVEIKFFNPIFGDSYPIGNKISALGLLPEGELGCFLDSDTVSMSHWCSDDILVGYSSAAKPADLSTWGSERMWEKVYRLTSTPLTARRVRLTVSDTLSFPYFNAGFVATSQAQKISNFWKEVAVCLNDPVVDLEDKYPWLDQIALPIAMQKVGNWRVLSEFYNYPAHLRPLGDNKVGICHYHQPGIILREPRLRQLFESAISEYPILKNLALKHENWSLLIKAEKPNIIYRERDRNFIITGIPRSGTSFLTSLLDAQKDWVVINEPEEIFSLLQSRTDSSGIEQYYSECRQRILSNQAISNKLKDGKVIEDTAIIDQREFYHPQISRTDFWLGSKNTLAYMASLDYLVRLNWPIVAMVRNPLDTLASWRNTFSHLREADVNKFPIAHPDFPSWATWQRAALIEIGLQIDPMIRRVLLWKLLAQTLLHYQAKVCIWRYEDLTADPQKMLGEFNNQLKYESPLKLSKSTSSRSRAIDHNETEREMLLDLCSPELVALNYKL